MKKKDVGERIDKVVSTLFKENSRSFLSKNIKDFVVVNDKVVKASYRLKEGDRVEVDGVVLKKLYGLEVQENEKLSKIVAQKGPLDIFYEDRDFLVLKKPAGLVVHPGISNYDNTLANYVKHYLIEKGEYEVGLKRAGIVHRLDMPVSGLIVFAKSVEFQKHLQKQFENHTVLKIYLADYEVCGGKVLFNEFKDIKLVKKAIEDFEKGLDTDLRDWYEVSGVMKRDARNRKRMVFERNVVNEKLRFAQSYLLPLSESKMCVLIKTGRMHQIRATLKSLDVVLVGDRLYGWKKDEMGEIALKSVVLGFVDMAGKRRVFNLI